MKLFILVISCALLPLAWGSNRLKELEAQCARSESPACCSSSLARLKAHGMVEPVAGKCPEGYDHNMLKCLSTLRWCEKRVPLKLPSST